MKKIDLIPPYYIEDINLYIYVNKTKKVILSNFKKYTKLKTFNCEWSNLTELPDLPNSLEMLWCSNNNLTKLPDLPNSLIGLYCYKNNLTELPNLPNSLKELNCRYNKLTKLPDLPNSLETLLCSNNNLIELPDLPNSIVYLWCSNNNLIYLDEDITTINKINLKNKIIKRMELLNRSLLLEHSARICMNPKRIQRLLDNLEIDFYDGSFDTLTN